MNTDDRQVRLGFTANFKCSASFEDPVGQWWGRGLFASVPSLTVTVSRSDFLRALCDAQYSGDGKPIVLAA